MSLSALAARRAPVTTIALVVVTAVGALVLGALAVEHTYVGLGIAVGVLGAAVALREPLVVPVAALLTVFVSQRVGGASGSQGGIAYSDLILAGASMLAWPMLVRTPALRRLRLPLIGIGAYLGLLIPTVVLNYAVRGDLEWMHRLVMVGGGLLVGAWIGQSGHTAIALRLLFAVSAAVAAIVAIDGASRGFSTPPTLLGWNKNFLGDLLADALVLAICLGRFAQLRPLTHRALVLVVTAGLAATLSRGGMLAAAVALTAVALIETRSRRLRPLIIVVALALATAVGFSIRADFNETAQNFNLNSIGTRFSVEHETHKIWQTSPVVGVGLKYFNTGHYGPLAQPPNNVVDNELAESGVIGLVGFIVLQGCAIAPGFRRRKELVVVVGASIVLTHLVHGMVDIYWIAGEAALPFMVLGMAMAEPADGERHPRAVG